MTDKFIELILDESKWLTFSLLLAFLGAAIFLFKSQNSTNCRTQKSEAIMNLLFGITIGTMAFGHLLAVSVKLILGTLEGSLLILYTIGIALAIPAWWLVYHGYMLRNSKYNKGNKTIALNSWLSITLLVVGVFNFPLALLGFLNIAYRLVAGKNLKRIIVGITIVIYLGLIVGSIIFFLSGKTFEELQAI